MYPLKLSDLEIATYPSKSAWFTSPDEKAYHLFDEHRLGEETPRSILTAKTFRKLRRMAGWYSRRISGRRRKIGRELRTS